MGAQTNLYNITVILCPLPVLIYYYIEPKTRLVYTSTILITMYSPVLVKKAEASAHHTKQLLKVAGHGYYLLLFRLLLISAQLCT